MNARLENWSIVGKAGDPYTEARLSSVTNIPPAPVFVAGAVYDSTKFIDGRSIVTSVLTGVHVDEDNKIVIETFSGSHYTLGTINPEYEKSCPTGFSELVQLAVKG